MDYKIIIDGTDVTDRIEILDDVLYVTDRAGAQADSAKMLINSASDFQLQKGHEMTVKFGGYTGGKMSVDKISPTTKNAVVEAVSAPAKAKIRRSRHYRNVRLFDVVNDVATETGFSVFYYENIVNWFYENVSRWNETPLAFLNRLCTREGYGLKVDDYRIIVYDKDTAEAKQSVLTITQADTIDNIVKFQDVSCVTESVRIVYYDAKTGNKIEYAAGFEEAGEQTVIKEYVKDVSEAERFSRGYLRDKNKYCTTAIALIPINTEIAATSNITFEGFGRYDGKYSIEEVTHCPITEQTKISARKIS